MLLKKIHIKQFRCFAQKTIDLDNQIVLIQGLNGSGKTSLLEALHYLCYLRSFRSHSPRDLVSFGADSFFIKAELQADNSDLPHEVQVGFSGKKRLVKINQKAVSSYKELMDYYRIVTLTEDDLDLISDGPEYRRAFIDQALLLVDPEFSVVLREYKHIVDSRNAFLLQGARDLALYTFWTEQLFNASWVIAQRRSNLLAAYAQTTNEILKSYFNDQLKVGFRYMPKRMEQGSTPDRLKDELYGDETRFGRSLFGAHLDDFSIHFQDKRSKAFASRGQQKLIIVLLKIAQLRHTAGFSQAPIFLLDDFLTDFDPERIEILLSILSELKNQLIFTSPMTTGFFEQKLESLGSLNVKLTH